MKNIVQILWPDGNPSTPDVTQAEVVKPAHQVQSMAGRLFVNAPKTVEAVDVRFPDGSVSTVSTSRIVE